MADNEILERIAIALERIARADEENAIRLERYREETLALIQSMLPILQRIVR